MITNEIEKAETAWEFLNNYIAENYKDCSNIPEFLDGFGSRKDGIPRAEWEVIRDGLKKFESYTQELREEGMVCPICQEKLCTPLKTWEQKQQTKDEQISKLEQENKQLRRDKLEQENKQLRRAIRRLMQTW